METEIHVLTEQVKYLKSMIEWMVEAHGESVTTEYTVDSSPWKLKDYVEENMIEFNKIDFRKPEVTSESLSIEVITNEHHDFKRLMYAIAKEMELNNGCNHTHDNFQKACNRLEELKQFKIDRIKTLEWMESHGGYCDCEILMNAQYV